MARLAQAVAWLAASNGAVVGWLEGLFHGIQTALVAQQMAAHESARTTGLYDRRGDDISLDEVERIVI